jgi:hypothetical protein
MKTCIEKILAGSYKNIKSDPPKKYKNVKQQKRTKYIKPEPRQKRKA